MRQLTFRTDHRYADRQGISLPVTLSPAGRKTSFAATLDTGASICVFERRRAEVIGIDVEAGMPTRISTVTGTFDAYAHELTIDVLEIEFETMVLFAADSFMPRNVLGRTGWLDRIRLGLIDHDQMIYLSHYDD